MHAFFKNSKWNSKRSQRSKLRLAQKSFIFPNRPAGKQECLWSPAPPWVPQEASGQGARCGPQTGGASDPRVVTAQGLPLSLPGGCCLLKEQGHSSSALLVNSSCCENWSQHNPLSSADKKVLLKCKILENVSTITRLHPLQC